MSATLLQVRTRMVALMGQSTSLGGLTITQMNDIIHEAVMYWTHGLPGYPFDGVSTAYTTPYGYVFLGPIALTYNSQAQIKEVLTLHSGSAVTDTPLERMPLDELIDLRTRIGGGGTPARYAVRDERYPVDSSNVAWYLYVYPVPVFNTDLAYTATVYHPKLTDDTHTFRLPDHEIYGAARLAAALGSEILDRDAGFVEELWSAVPEEIRSKAQSASLSRMVADG